jgi:hypothetical protein
MSKLDDILIDVKWSVETQRGVDILTQKELAKSKQQIKDLVLEIIGEDEEPKYNIGEATRGDTPYDHASAIYGENQVKEEFRQKVNEL